MKVTNYFLNFDFAGRARRSHYWANLAIWWAVFIALIIIGGMGVNSDGTPRGGAIASLLFFAALIAAFIDGVAMTFRRAHDTGKSGWVWLLLLIPLVNLLPLYWLLIQDSDQGPNKYGPPVKQFYQPPAAA